MRPTRQCAAAFLLFVVTGVACGAATPTGPSDSGSPRKGGTLTYLFLSEPRSLFPDAIPTGAAIGTAGPERFAIYDALAVIAADGSLVMRIAESMTSADGVTWTIKVRPNVKFSDGTPFDAVAIKDNWDRIADPATKSPSARVVKNISSTTVIDSRTLTVNLKTNDALFPQYLAQSPLTHIASPTSMKTQGAAFATAPVGAGPYVLKSWSPGSQMSLTRNPTYYGTTYLDQLLIKYVGDEQQRYNTLITSGGDAEFSTNIIIGATARTAGLTVKTPALNGGQNLIFNAAAPPFNNVIARQAIAFAINRKALNDTLYNGNGQLALTLFDKGSQYYTPVALPDGDSKKAQQLLDQFASQNAGKPLQFTLLTDPTGLNVAQWLQSSLSGFKNISVSINSLTSVQETTLVLARNFQIALSLSPRFIDPYPNLTNSLATGGSANVVGYSNSEMDAALIQAQSSQDVATRRNAYRTVQQILANEVPYDFLLRVASQNIFNGKNVGAFPILNDGLPDWANAWKRAS